MGRKLPKKDKRGYRIHRGPPKHSPRKIEARMRQAEAVELRIQGFTKTQIAEKLGYKSRSGVHKAIETAMLEMVAGPAEELLGIEIARLEREIKLLHETRSRLFDLRGRIEDIEDAKDCDRVLKAEEQIRKTSEQLRRFYESHRKLLGLDAPQRHSAEVSGPGGGAIKTEVRSESLSNLSDEELDSRIAKAQAEIASNGRFAQN